MSLRYASRVMYQAGKRLVQEIKDQVSNVKALRDSASSPSSSSSSSSSSSCSKQVRRFSGATEYSGSSSIKDDWRKQAEESLRTVMFLSCWGPN